MNANAKKSNNAMKRERTKNKLKNMKQLFEFLLQYDYTNNIKEFPMGLVWDVAGLIKVDAIKTSTEFKDFILKYKELYNNVSLYYSKFNQLRVTDFVSAMVFIKSMETSEKEEDKWNISNLPSAESKEFAEHVQKMIQEIHVM